MPIDAVQSFAIKPNIHYNILYSISIPYHTPYTQHTILKSEQIHIFKLYQALAHTHHIYNKRRKYRHNYIDVRGER